MNSDDFEQQLRHQPLRPLPDEWRQQILTAARRNSPDGSRRAFGSSLGITLRNWLWPHPVAWGTLATCWVLTVILNLAAAPTSAEQAQARRVAPVEAACSALLRDPAAVALTAGPEADPPFVKPRRLPPDLSYRTRFSTFAVT